MKKIVLYLIAVMTMTTVNSQTLTERQKGLAACACLMAQGDMNRLEPAVRMALFLSISWTNTMRFASP